MRRFGMQLLLMLHYNRPDPAGAGRRAVLELDDGEVLPQRDFVHYDREADEMDAHGVKPACLSPMLSQA